ncbi:hypothetical protein BCEN4_740042 [Burkholderia cenocepacia]|nr:hypothetical protein BCEN4_740042 [Burkholderia cenocepacia]
MLLSFLPYIKKIALFKSKSKYIQRLILTTSFNLLK